MRRLRENYDLKPLVIHTNYLVNLASTTPLFLKKSIEAFRGELQRALAICADYLVLHPGSFRGADREAGLLQTAAAIAAAAQGLDLAGYDIVSPSGWRDTLAQLDTTVGLKDVRVWHCNDAKAACGSKLDRHQYIGKGSIGLEPFRRLLNEPRVAHAAFIAETPIDEPGDDRRNVEALKGLVSRQNSGPKL
jgi:deoxyribonuclease-4